MYSCKSIDEFIKISANKSDFPEEWFDEEWEEYNKEKRSVVKNGEVIVYHSVYKPESIKYVQENGISPDRDGFVYLSKYPIIKNDYKYVFEVHLPRSMWDNFYDWREFWGGGSFVNKSYDQKNPYFLYQGIIPPEYCKLVQ